MAAGRHPLRVRPRRLPHPPARRRLVPRVRVRPGARLRRALEGARGQRAHAFGDLVRAREPDRDEPPAAGAVHGLRRAPGQPLPRPAARRAACRGARRRRGPGRGGLDAGPGQQRLLRARLPRAPDGRRAGRGERPRGPRRPLLHAHHAWTGARRLDLPAHRRRLHGPARVPLGLAPGRAGADGRLPGRQRRDRERGRDGCRRRQGDLPLRARDDPLLPGRGADPRQPADLAARGSRAARLRARAPPRARGQADRRVRRQGGIHRAARERGAAGARARPDRAGARSLDRTADGVALDGADGAAGRVAGAAARRPAAVRRLRRRDQDRPGRADAGRPARRVDDREQLPGRRLQGHLGAGRGERARRRPPADSLAPPSLPGMRQAGWLGQEQQQQQQAGRA